jgi:hypothetical protein
MTINFRVYPQWAAHEMASARLDGIRRRRGARDRGRDAARGCKRGDRAGHKHGRRHAALALANHERFKLRMDALDQWESREL